jgi:hypothetical protein
LAYCAKWPEDKITVLHLESLPNEFSRVFLLSPARVGGARSGMLFREQAEFDLAVRLRAGKASIGETYSFISGLYFRGKMAYAEAFAAPPEGAPPALVIVPGVGLAPLETPMDLDRLRNTGNVDVDENNQAFRSPLVRDAETLNQIGGPHCLYVLLGSIASEKYTEPLLSVFDNRILFPAEFVGRGDMSRGGLMLRRALSGEELPYVRLVGATRRGQRPPKLGAPERP